LGAAYAPLGDLVRERYGLFADDSARAVRQRLGHRSILGLTLGIEGDPDLHPLAAHRKLGDALVSLLEEITAHQPAVLLIEDLHWAEAPLPDLLDRLATEVAGPLLMLVTARPEYRAAASLLSAARDVTTVWLEPLPDGDTDLLFDELVGDALPAELRRQLVQRCEGNPFFAEELLADLIDSGTLVKDTSGWHAELRLPALPVSDSIQSLLAARIDLLPPAEKHALQAASVIGQTFWAGAVAELMPDDPCDLAMLERRDFVRHRLRSTITHEREFVFKHALTRDVAYASVPTARRASMHATFARWLERVGGGRDEDASPLAHHYAQSAPADDGQLRAKALMWLRRAGLLAIGRFEIDDGITLLQRAVDLEPSASARSELWRAIGRAKAINYDAAGMWTAMEAAIVLADDAAVRADICSEVAAQTAFRAGMLTSRSTTDTAVSWTRRALELAAPGTPARALALAAAVSCRLPAALAGAAEEAEAIARELDDPTLCYFAWDACSLAAFHACDDQSAWSWQMRRLELLDRISDPDLIADIPQSLVVACVATGRFEQAGNMAHWQDQITQPSTPHHRVHGVALLVELAEALGDWPAVCALERRVRDAVTANTATPCVRNTRTLLACAVAHEILGRSAQADSLLQAAQRIGLPTNDRVDTPRLQLALLRNDQRAAEQLLRHQLLGPRAMGRESVDNAVARLDAFPILTIATRLDALQALGLHDRLAAEAEPQLTPGTYLEPFALRALGRARNDPALIHTAITRFEHIGLSWHAGQTRAAENR
jgi:hypothetical protein